jgi:hypothetical protein
MAALSGDTLGSVLEFTTVLDERKDLRAYGFLIELDGMQGVYQYVLGKQKLIGLSRRKPRKSPSRREEGAALERGLQEIH